jgi:hypothetical protein
MLAGCDTDLGGIGGESHTVLGGPPSAPGELSLDMQNEIGMNAYYNYFQYDGAEHETLTFDAVLENAILKDQQQECLESGDTFIAVYDADLNQMKGYRTCTKHMELELPIDGNYKFQFRYPGNKGYIEVDSSKYSDD